MTPATALPEDAALPHLAQALDGAAMAEAFGHALGPHSPWAVLGCEVERIKYRPQRNATLAYRLALRHRASGAALTQRVAARLCRGDAPGRAARPRPAPLQPSPAGPALQHLPALDMLTWWWPNDPKLAAPHWLADDERLRRELLPELLAPLGADLASLQQPKVEVVQYVPEQRLCARVDLAWRGGTARIYAKASLEPGGEEAHRILRALQATPAWQDGRLQTPRALAWQPACGLHWQSGLPGQALLDLPAERSLACAAGLGAQLATLHATSVPGLPCATPDALRARLAEVVTVLAAALPDSQSTLRQAAERLETGLAAFGHAPHATLHGDLHPRNLLVAGDRLGLIDLDGLHRAPAVLDIGSWMAEGVYRALLEGAAPMRDRATWDALLRGYASAGGACLNEPALAWATAWNLLTQRAWRCVVNLKPGRFALAPALVALAAHLAACPAARPAALEPM